MKKIIKPKELCIECNASCQLRCPECPTTSNNSSPVFGYGFLKFRNFKKLIDDNPQFMLVQLQNRGELFLNPELLDIIKYAHKKKVALYCDSGVNLNNVRDQVLEGLAKYRFRSILCSIDGATPEIYKIYRVGGNLNRVIENVRKINYFKKKYRSKFPVLAWQFVVFGHNEHEIPKARKLAHELNMSFVTKMAWDSDYSPIRNKEFVRTETGWNAATREEYEKVEKVDYSRHVCYELWKSPRINWDGKVIGCCWNNWAEFGGNVFSEGYIASINSEKMNYAREMLLGNKETHGGLPCSSCKLYLKMKASNRYLTMKEIFRNTPLWYRTVRFIYLTFSLRRNWFRFWSKKLPGNLE